jgi:DNA modification methylase
MGIPWRVAFALIDDGWILRNAVIWYKPNHMPSSVKDRLTQTYEYIFHFVKGRKYYYNLDMVREPHKESSIKRYEKAVNENPEKAQHKGSSPMFGAGSQLRRERAVLGAPKYSLKWSNPESPIVEYFRMRGSGGNYDYGGLNSPEGRHHAGNGKNPGDVFNIPRHSKFLEFSGSISSPAARALKTLLSGKVTTYVKRRILDVGAYLKRRRMEAGIGFDELSRLTGIKRTTLEHYFRTDFSGQALPDRETWNILKPILKLGEYDEYISEEIRNALPMPHPLGRNIGDFWSIATRPLKKAHFAPFPYELPLRPILASCPPDGVVLDPLAGSGTVALTCELINHGLWDRFRLYVNDEAKKVRWSLKWILIDINPQYCRIAEDRLKQFISQKKITEYV